MDKTTTVEAERGVIGVGGVEIGDDHAYGGEMVGYPSNDEMGYLVAQPLCLRAGGPGRRYDCTLVSAGRVKRRDGGPSNWVITPESLQTSSGRFVGVAMFVDHPGFFDDGRSVRDLAGVTEDARFEENELRGTIRFYEEGAGALAAALFDQILVDRAAGRPTPDVGLSAVFWHRSEIVGDDRLTTEFTHVESVDVVFGPGAKGAVRAALRAVDVGACARPQEGDKNMGDELKAQDPEGGGGSASPAVASAAADPFGGWTPDQVASLQRSQQQAQGLLVQQSQTFLDAKLQMLTGILPQPSLDHIRRQFQGRVFAAQELEAAVDNQRALLASLTQAGVVRGMGAIGDRHMLNEVDQVQLAYEKLMGLEVQEPVQALTGIKELYILLTGDRNMRGLYQGDFAMLQTTSATMAEITRNVLNKVLLQQWAALGEAGYNWWQKICHIEDFQSIQQVSWVTVAGLADLLTVAEGAAYLEITAWDDARETATWVKKGGYIGLTLEMIDKDDVGAWRAVPRVLATAGIRTLSAAVAAIFTDNAGLGPTLVDTFNVFDAANHANLITSFLDADNWDLAVTTMFKQTELGSAKRLGIRPRYLLVPVDQEKKGLQVLGSGVEPVSGVFYDNVRKMATDNVIVVPEWTDTDNWAAVADPVLAPGIGIGFRWGRVPELFTVTDPRMGLMFTNDILPIKVRYMYACGVINYRAMVKSNC